MSGTLKTDRPATASSPTEQAAPRRKLFSIVSAVYNVAPYLDDFIESIESQDFPLDALEIIMVNDGSTDESLTTLEAWQDRRPELVQVITKENGGQSSARNLGMTYATGEWITFTDPDDMLGEGYLASVRRLIHMHPDTPLVATNRIFFEEATGELRDGHPLRSMFADGDKKVELDRFPQYFWHHVGAGFFQLDEIRRLDLTFDERVRPNFEDGHFCARYLLGTREAMILAASARYIYRRRADQSSTLQTSYLNEGKFLNVPRYGYLDALARAAEARGAAPEWLQNMVIYDLTWYFTTEEAMFAQPSVGKGDIGRQFVEALAEIRQYLDPLVIESFRIRRIGRHLRQILLHGLSGADWHSPYAVLDRYDSRARLVRVVYRYVGVPPSEEFLSRGVRIHPAHAKTRNLIYFGQLLMVERIAWVSARGTLRVRLGGALIPLQGSEPPSQPTYLRPAAITRVVEAGQVERGERPAPRSGPGELKDLAVLRAADMALARKKFRKSWVVMDRTDIAGDNGERLFEYLREHRRDIDAWFVIEKGTPDWVRLSKGEHRSRLVAYGSLQWKLLLLNCRHLVSSHAEKPVVAPDEITRLRRPDYKTTFLQHGVIQNDLSGWLNSKRLDLFITSTQGEYHSIVADGSPYVFTTKEVKLTGLPRFDRLGRIAADLGTGQRNLVLIAPTWRQWLNAPSKPGTQRREVVPDFLTTEYAREWLGVLRSDELARSAAEHGLEIGFLPHPNIQPVLRILDLPTHVRRLSFQEQDVQELFARTALMVTDYSSMAFDMGFLGRPVTYFQFDEQRTREGGHTFRPGYFDYRRDGFGPVTSTLEETVAAACSIIGKDCRSSGEYQQRLDLTFTLRDGHACERVVAAIEALP